MPQQRPTEIATLIVRGKKFEDWESVWVQKRWADAFSYFRFNAAERDTQFTGLKQPRWYRLQFKPGDPCTIELAGFVAITGFIETRQVAYDARNHAVQLIGKSNTAPAARSSVLSESGNFDNMNFEQIAAKVLAPYGITYKTVGAINKKPYEKMQNSKGERVWDFLERIARQRGIVLGSDAFGNFLIIDKHKAAVTSNLIEGVNIKSAQVVITKDQTFTMYGASTQSQGSDDHHGPSASEQEAWVTGMVSQPLKSALLTPTEEPIKSIVELQDRAKNEALWHDGTSVQVTAVVYGWLNDAGALWEPGENVFFDSPMAMLKMILKIQNATFTQDNRSGTQTTLELVPPWLLKDGSHWGGIDDAGLPSGPDAEKALENVTTDEAQRGNFP